MKKTTFILLIALFTSHVLAQKPKKATDLYWFYMKLDIVKYELTHSSIYEFTKVYPKIHSGNSRKFSKMQKKKMKKGYVAIGPFKEETTATHSILCYDKKDGYKTLKKENIDKEYYLYTTKIVKGKINKSLEFRRIPTSINERDMKFFIEILEETKLFLILTIGPFVDKKTAEKSMLINEKLQK